MARLTKTTVERLEVKEKPYFAFDDQIPGFCVRVAPNGRRHYYAQYMMDKKIHRMTIGLHGVVSADEARERVQSILLRVRDGEDPVQEKKKRESEPRLSDIAERFIKEHALLHCKPSTVYSYRDMLKRLIMPCLGTYRISQIQRQHIAQFQHSLSRIPGSANKCVMLLSKIFNLAELWGLRPDNTNPCRHVKLYKEKARNRFLNQDELQRLSQALIAAEEARLVSPYAIAAFRLLILTGARLGEIQSCKWEYVDLNQRVIRLPDSKTGAKIIHLGQLAAETLRAIPKIEGNPYVICAELVPGKPIPDLQKPWRAIRGWAGIPDVRIHDLRHTFASNAVAMGMSLPMIGKLLGHTQTQTTARYAHLAVHPVIEAATQVTDKMGEVFSVPVRLPAPDIIDAEYCIIEEPKVEAPIIQRLGNGLTVEAPRFMTSEEAAQWLGVDQRLMENWRWRKVGPRFVKVGNRVRYCVEDLKVFVQKTA